MTPMQFINPVAAGKDQPEIMQGILSGLGSALCFSMMTLIVRAQAHRFPASELMFARGLVGVICLAPLVFSDIPKLVGRYSALLWLRFLGGAFAIIALFHNIQITGVGPAQALGNLAAVFVVILSVIILKERFNTIQWFGITLVLLGAATLQSPFSFNAPLSVVLVGVAGAFSGSVAMISLKKVSKFFPANLVVFGFCLVTLLLALCFPSAPWSIGWDFATLLLIISGLLGLFGQLLLTTSYLLLPAALASTLTLSALVWGVTFESIYYGEMPDYLACCCYVLMLVGLNMAQRQHSSSRP